MSAPVLPAQTIVQAATLMSAGALSARELTEATLARIDALEPDLHAHTVVFGDRARADAARLDTERAAGRVRGPLHGVPVSVKDLLDIEGVATMAGMPLHADRIADGDATVVRRLRQAGAVIVGKTQLSEGAGAAHHPSVTRPVNPWNRDYWTGISSSGSGVSVSSGMALGTIGTDTGGSIRFPSAACGLTGIKPSYGRVSRDRLAPLAASFDHVGPLARSAEDAAIILAAIAGHDPQEPTSLIAPLGAVPPGIAGLRIGVDRDYASARVLPPVRAAIDSAIESFASVGAQIVAVSMPSTDEILSVGMALLVAEQITVHADAWANRRDAFGPSLAGTLAAAEHMTAAMIADAGLARDRFRGRLAAMFTGCDLFLCPMMPEPTMRLEEVDRLLASDFAGFGDRIPRFAIPFNASGSPAMSLPAGLDEAGMPLAVQLVGRPGEDALLLAGGIAFQRATDWHMRMPEI